MHSTTHDEPAIRVRGLRRVYGRGPSAYEAVLASVVRTVHEGGRHVDSELAAEAIDAGESPLTTREADAADGSAVDEIAARASLSPGTVRNSLSSAISKLDAGNRQEAAAKARRMGWI